MNLSLKLILTGDISLLEVGFLSNIVEIPIIERIYRNMQTFFIGLFLDFTKESGNGNIPCRDLLVEGRSEP